MVLPNKPAPQLTLFPPTPKVTKIPLGASGKTRSTSEALALLNDKRGHLAKMGRDIGEQLCRKNGTATSREVRAEMLKRGLLAKTDEREHWLGAVFNDQRFEWTGDWKTYSDPARNVHERTIKIWRLKNP